MKQRGFTIIELIVYVGLLGIILAVMSQVLLSTVSLRVESEGANNVQQDSRFVMARVGYDVRRASAIVSPAVGATSSELVLTIPENGIAVTYTYSTASGNLVLTAGSASAQLNSNGTRVAAFNVTRIGNSGTMEGAKDTVQIEMRVLGSSDVEAGIQELELRSVYGLR